MLFSSLKIWLYDLVTKTVGKAWLWKEAQPCRDQNLQQSTTQERINVLRGYCHQDCPVAVITALAVSSTLYTTSLSFHMCTIWYYYSDYLTSIKIARIQSNYDLMMFPGETMANWVSTSICIEINNNGMVRSASFGSSIDAVSLSSVIWKAKESSQRPEFHDSRINKNNKKSG